MKDATRENPAKTTHTDLKRKMAATLMKENQNSVSAKKRTESAFEVKITTMNRALQIHTGVPGNHLRR